MNRSDRSRCDPHGTPARRVVEQTEREGTVHEDEESLQGISPDQPHEI